MEKQEIKKLLNVPNILSFFRLLCVPLFLVLFFWFAPDYWPALIVFLVASLTDVIDGFVARKYNQITMLGIVLDPLADKLLKMATLFAFAYVGIIPWWIFGVLFGIDASMILVGTILFKRKIAIPSNIIGKTGTLVMSVGLVMCFFPDIFAPWNVYCLYIGLGIVISSVILYVALNFKTSVAQMKEYKLNKKAKKEEDKQKENAKKQSKNNNQEKKIDENENKI